LPKPRRDRGLLLVPVLPGTVLRSVELAEPPAQAGETADDDGSRSVLFAAAIVAVPAFVAVAAVLVFARGSGSGQATTTARSRSAAPAPPAAVHRVHHQTPVVTVQQPAAREDPAKARALRLAAHLPVSLASTALLHVGTSIYAVGGTLKDGAVSDRIWQLDLRTGTVTAAGTFVEPLTDSASVVRGGVLYLVGGWTGSEVATGVLRWTPAQSSALVARLPEGHRGGSAAFVGGLLYVAGGSPAKVFEVDLAAATVKTAPSPPEQLARQSAANLDYLMSAASIG
jgi:hypothetical protein